jgi:hypothetical protein
MNVIGRYMTMAILPTQPDNVLAICASQPLKTKRDYRLPKATGMLFHGGEIACASSAVRTWGAQPAMKHRGYSGLAFARRLSHARIATRATAACELRSFASNPQPIDRSPLTHGVTAKQPHARTGDAEIAIAARMIGSAKRERSMMLCSYPSRPSQHTGDCSVIKITVSDHVTRCPLQVKEPRIAPELGPFGSS